jgi:ATP-binding cassette subfamily C protein
VLYLRLSPRFTALQACIQEILVCGPTLGMIAEVRARAIENEEAHGAEPAFCGKFGEIRFDRVAYSYDSAGELGGVREASFRIRNNCITALIGPSGAGKSTLADLIMGLLEEQSGAILIDGKPLTGANRKAWRDLIAYVPQDTFLLHDTIAANLRLGRPQASEEELWSALKMANAETFVRAMPAGLQSVVGDRGGLLSGGERQRIALARAVLRRPKLLVLDEATNALDPETQRSINRSIMALRSEMAIVIIAHHPGMIAAADDVITIEAGCVVEAGATDLLRENPDSRLSRFAAMTGVS